jgi:hypothetical protein
MRLSLVTALLVQLSVIAFSQGQATQSSFEVASVRPSQQDVGPDYNNQITYSPDGFTGRNVTLRRLVAKAWQCQLDQVFGPPWLDHNEYDIATRVPEGASKEQIRCQSLFWTKQDWKAFMNSAWIYGPSWALTNLQRGKEFSKINWG